MPSRREQTGPLISLEMLSMLGGLSFRLFWPWSQRVQVPNNHILTQNLYYNYYYQSPKYLDIGYADPQGVFTIKKLIASRFMQPLVANYCPGTSKDVGNLTQSLGRTHVPSL